MFARPTKRFSQKFIKRNCHSSGGSTFNKTSTNVQMVSEIIGGGSCLCFTHFALTKDSQLSTQSKIFANACGACMGAFIGTYVWLFPVMAFSAGCLMTLDHMDTKRYTVESMAKQADAIDATNTYGKKLFAQPVLDAAIPSLPKEEIAKIITQQNKKDELKQKMNARKSELSVNDEQEIAKFNILLDEVLSDEQQISALHYKLFGFYPQTAPSKEMLLKLANPYQAELIKALHINKK